jgi:hypothetical protein
MAASKFQIDGDHYVKMAVQPWDIIDTWPVEQQIAFHRGNAIKYLLRMFDKDTPQSNAEKAAHYISKMLEVMENAPS